MSHVAYVNGVYLPQRQAQLSIDDRATQFGDAVYEVTCIWNGAPVDHAAHLARLERSLKALHIVPHFTPAALSVICREIVCRNRIDRGILYIQVSRGVAARAHPFPSVQGRTGIVVTGRHGTGPSDAVAEQGVKVITGPDIRWGRCDVKTVGLLGNVLARQAAVEAGAFETLLVSEDGTVTEASASNAWIVAPDGTLVTHPLGPAILGGVTRATVLALAQAAGHPVRERPFTLEEAMAAREVFLTGTTTFVMPVVRIGTHTIANGHPGSIATDLRRRYLAHVEHCTTGSAAWTS
jgi:D-alanine transaminase